MRMFIKPDIVIERNKIEKMIRNGEIHKVDGVSIQKTYLHYTVVFVLSETNWLVLSYRNYWVKNKLDDFILLPIDNSNPVYFETPKEAHDKAMEFLDKNPKLKEALDFYKEHGDMMEIK